jgi:hypothetical protein
VEVNPTVLHFSRLLNRIANTYKSMWAYKIHYQVDDNERRMAHATYDSGVARMFNEGNQCSTRN